MKLIYSEFPSLIGRLTTYRRLARRGVFCGFPSLIGRLTTIRGRPDAGV